MLIEHMNIKRKKMILYIKNMNSAACIIYIKSILKRLNIQYLSIEFGKIEIVGDIHPHKLLKLNALLKNAELELVEDNEVILVEKIKTHIIQIIKRNVPLKHNYSIILSDKLGEKYSYLSKIFLKICHVSIKKYYDFIKIEKIKELIHENKMNMSEIADIMHYSSASHLSHQFKQITHITPLEYKHSIDGK